MVRSEGSPESAEPWVPSVFPNSTEVRLQAIHMLLSVFQNCRGGDQARHLRVQGKSTVVVVGTEMESSEICLKGEEKRVQNGCSLSLALFSPAGQHSGHEAMGSLQNPMSPLRPQRLRTNSETYPLSFRILGPTYFIMSVQFPALPADRTEGCVCLLIL